MGPAGAEDGFTNVRESLGRNRLQGGGTGCGARRDEAGGERQGHGGADDDKADRDGRVRQERAGPGDVVGQHCEEPQGSEHDTGHEQEAALEADHLQ
jgi:hypothetical protein